MTPTTQKISIEKEITRNPASHYNWLIARMEQWGKTKSKEQANVNQSIKRPFRRNCRQ